jgi:hypothetical protein
MVHRKFTPEELLEQYENTTMTCEADGCDNGVARTYHPFCFLCFRQGILRGSFQSRDGRSYRYNGVRWIICSVV